MSNKVCMLDKQCISSLFLELSVSVSCIQRVKTLPLAVVKTTVTLVHTSRTTPRLHTIPLPLQAMLQRPDRVAVKSSKCLMILDLRLLERVIHLLDNCQAMGWAQKLNLYFAHIPCWSTTNSTARQGIRKMSDWGYMGNFLVRGQFYMINFNSIVM